MRKIPQRKCIACQQHKEKKGLIRVVRTPEGEVKIDPTGKAAGRGAYLCRQSECFKLAKKAKAFQRALKVNVLDDVYDKLEQEWIHSSNG